MIFKLSLLLLFSYTLLVAEHFESNYFVKDDFVMLSDVVSNPNKDVKLFDIDANRHTKRIKEEDLLKRLQDLGYTSFSPKHNYIQFSKKSPISVEKLKNYVQNFYENKYTNITIQNISVEPRSYIEKLPALYEIGSDDDIHLKNSGIIFLETLQNKKIFFNYTIRAKVEVIQARDEMKRSTELSNINTQKESIILDKFRAMPLQNIEAHTLELKHRVKAGRVLTSRDVVGLYLIRRGSKVNVTLLDGRVIISFLAEASQNGRYGENISVVKSDGTKIKVVVTGKNKAEMR